MNLKIRTPVSVVILLLISAFVMWANAQEPTSPQQPQAPQPVIYICPMHKDVSSKVPGVCTKCGMSLVAAGSGEAQEFYACPMHADVISNKPGNCPKCNMALKKMAAPIAEDFDIKMETTPKLVKPGQKVKFRFTVFHPKTGKQIEDFNILHDMPFHLFVVSRDFNHFDHIHPEKQKDGSFTIDTVLPKAGHYQIFCDLFPVGGMPQVIHKHLITAGYTSDVLSAQAKLTPDKSLVKTVDGIRFELKFDPEAPVAGKEAVLKYHLTDAATGKPVTNIQPYLGAWGHTLILSEDATDYLHSHPVEMIPENVDRTKLASKPIIDFDTFFPRPGNYKIWSQFQHDNKITTVSFNVFVPRMN
ncbi:MAG TPA: heavy metal-binding domain-containing protein [Blastocatellia bacterium]|nr:heavy metal-binding domain-containing protein [Blastocatellia bacterium]